MDIFKRYMVLAFLLCCMLVAGTLGATRTSRSPRVENAPKREKNDRFDLEIKQKSIVLDSIKQELQRGRARIDSLARQESGYLTRLDQLEKNIATAQSYTRLVGGRIDQLTVRIDSLTRSITITGAQLQQRQRIMAARLRAMYKSPPAGWLQLLFESGDPAQGIKRARMFAAINQYDRVLLQAIDTSRSMLWRQRTQLELDRVAQSTLKTEKEHEQKTLVHEQATRSTMLKDIQSQKKAYTRMVRELEESQTQINAIIASLEKKRKKALFAHPAAEKALSGVFAKNRGRLSWPVSGMVVGRYGRVEHPVFKTITMNNGIDIRAAQGTPVVSVASGTVIFISWMRGLGRFVIVDHGDGYITIYAHLEGVSVTQNESVMRGDTLGQVGETGSLTGAQLHFEIRHKTEALDPIVWLVPKGKS